MRYMMKYFRLCRRREETTKGVASAALAVLFDVLIGLGSAGAPTRLPAVAASLLLALACVVFVSAITDAVRSILARSCGLIDTLGP